jgi:hypothetical protein
LRLGPLSITALDYKFAEASNEYDANWLIVRIKLLSEGLEAGFDDKCLLTMELLSFHDALDALLKGYEDKAELSPMEPYLWASVRKQDSLGHYQSRIVLRLPNTDAKIDVSCELDQTDLHAAISSLKAINRRLPVRMR